MLATIKSEFRKLLSVRSTYFVCLLSLILVGIYLFYIEGFLGRTGSSTARETMNGSALSEAALGVFSSTGIFIAIIAILQAVHEYRHNTIMYTLTTSSSRTKALFSKALVLTGFGVFFALFCVAFGIGMYLLALSIKGASLPPQTTDWAHVLGRGVFYSAAYASLGMIIAFLSRNIAAAIAIFLVFPTAVENLLVLLLRDNAVYLPFSALEKVLAVPGNQGIAKGDLSVPGAILVSCGYLAIGWVITWILYLRRDVS
jgi:ABC-type transport system involved in multi-copper enzyme maturation permease subunit